MMAMPRHVAHTREVKNAFSILVGKSEEKRLLARRSGRWEYNITMELKETTPMRMSIGYIWLRTGSGVGRTR
jgi:hypothetical protein